MRSDTAARVTRRDLLRGAGMGAGALVVAHLTGCSRQATTSGGVFRAQAAVSHLNDLVHAAPMHIAKQLGYYRDEQLDVEHISFPGGSQTIRGMEGRIGFGMPATLALLIAYEKGRKDLRVIGSLFNAASIDFITPTGSRIRSIKDLKGAKVAVSSPGSNSEYFAQRTIRQAGLTVGKDVQVLNLGEAPNAWTAASKGVVDVAWSASPLLDQLVVSGKARTVWRTRDYVKSWIDTCLAVRQDFLDDNRDAMRRWVKAIARAVELINSDPAKAADAYAAAVKLDPAVAKSALTSWPKGTWNVRINDAGLQACVRAAMEQGQIKTASPLDQIVVRDLTTA